MLLSQWNVVSNVWPKWFSYDSWLDLGQIMSFRNWMSNDLLTFCNIIMNVIFIFIYTCVCSLWICTRKSIINDYDYPRPHIPSFILHPLWYVQVRPKRGKTIIQSIPGILSDILNFYHAFYWRHYFSEYNDY